MPSLHALWRTIEREEVLAGVEAQWQLWLGDALDVLRPFLKPEQNLASSYPCERHPDACARRVVHHGPDDIVAVCGLDESECDRRPLTRADAVVYALALPRLLAGVGEALGCGGDVQPVCTRAWSLGVRPGGAHVFFVLPERETGFAAPLATLLAHHPTGEFVLIVPTADTLAAADRALLSQRRAAALVCDEVIDLNDDGQLVHHAPASYVIPPPEVLSVHEGPATYAQKPVAICWRHDSATPVQIIDAGDLDRVRAIESDVEHFVDATVDKPRCSKRNGKKKRDEDRLTAGQVSMLAAYLARATRNLDHERPENLRIPNVTTVASRKKAFNDMRRKVDVTTDSRRSYRLFKDRASFSGGPQEYEFRPDEGASYCFLVRFEHFSSVESAVIR